MFEAVTAAVAAWREVLHVSEWTGLSIGALAGLGALIWFVPLARRLAIAGIVLVLVAWASLVHGDAVGRADLQQQWDAARAAAEAAQVARDAAIEQRLAQTYQPQLAELQQQADERTARGDAYEHKILELLAADPAVATCQLGAAANRVRRH